MKAEKSVIEDKAFYTMPEGAKYFKLPVEDIKDKDYVLGHVTNYFGLPDSNKIVTAAISFMETIKAKPQEISIKEVCSIMYKLITVLKAEEAGLKDNIKDLSLCIVEDEGIYHFIV